MEILKLIPAYKDYLWGGNRLKEKYGKETDMTPLAESWELSCHEDGLSVIADGAYKGASLREYIAANKKSLGTQNKTGELPVLIKLIDANDNLSIQVHPNDEQAREWENQNGKTEMWYVVECEPGAQIIHGVKEEITEEKFAEAIKNHTVMSFLKSVPSEKGKVFFVKSGTVHAICKGNLIAEIQQNSNVTYRLYDYDRRDKNGNPRELHIEKGIKASVLKPPEENKIIAMPDGTRLIANCEYFSVRELMIDGNKTIHISRESYQAILNVSGKVKINHTELRQGECAFLPATDDAYEISGNGTVLITANPLAF